VESFSFFLDPPSDCGTNASSLPAVLAALVLAVLPGSAWAEGKKGAAGVAKASAIPIRVAAWTHVQDNPGNNALTSPTALTNSFSVGGFPSPVRVGNYVVVGVTGYDWTKYIDAGDIFCTDNGSTPNSYRQLFFFRAANGDQTCIAAAFLAKITSNPSSGHLSPTVFIGNGKVTLMSLGAAEFSGGSLDVDGSPVLAEQDYITRQASLNFTLSTSAPRDLLIGVISDNRSGSFTWTLPSGFTSIGAQSDGTDFVPGQIAYRVLSGTLSNELLTWGNSGAVEDGTVCAAIVAVRP
jgi:hypothetical protein